MVKLVRDVVQSSAICQLDVRDHAAHTDGHSTPFDLVHYPANTPPNLSELSQAKKRKVTSHI